jgi:TRAP-type C4-dicarboxylate transport system permease small subunit
MGGIFGLKAYNRLKRIRNGMDKVIEHLIVFLLALLVATVAFQVIYRFIIVKFFSFSFPFTEEMAIYSMVWVTYLAIGICLKEGMHATVTIISDRLSNIHLKYILYFGLRILMTFFILFVIYNGANLAFGSFTFKTSTLGIPMTFIYLAPVVGSILMMFQIIVEFFGVIFNNEDPFADKTKGGA